MKKISLIVSFMFSGLAVYSQTGIGTKTVDASALMELKSANRGFLPPRVQLQSGTDIITIPAPATGLTVYHTGIAGMPAGLYVYSGTTWTNTNTSLTWGLTGNASTLPATNFIGTSDNIDFVTRTNNTERMRVTGAGNVGIGTTATNLPGQKLTVIDAANANQFNGTVSVLANDLTAGLGIGYQGIQAIGTNANNDLNLNGRGTGNIILQATSGATGNVGIGITTPHAQLQLSQTGGNRKIVLYEAGNNDNQVMGFGVNTQVMRYQVPDLNNSHVFYAASSATASNELMRIQGNGNVGIGTAPNSPGQRLTVVDAVNTNQFSGIVNVLANNLTVGVGIGYAGIQTIGSNPNTDFSLAAKGTGNILLQATNGATGRVGIGTQNPTQALHVVGDAYKTAGTSSWLIPSDRRVKKDVRPFTDGLQQVMQINPVFFKYNGKGDIPVSTSDQVGIIAQDMQKIAPYTIKETSTKIDESGKGMLQLQKADAIMYMLVNGMKEQQAMINAQQASIKKLEAELKMLKEMTTKKTTKKAAEDKLAKR